MDTDFSTLADLLPNLSGGDGALTRIFPIVSFAVAAAILVALAAGKRLYRRWSVGKLRTFSGGELVAPNVVAEGMSATLETPTATGMGCFRSVVRSVERRWIALAAPDDAESGIGVGAPVSVRVLGETAVYLFHSAVVDRRCVNGVSTLYVEKPIQVEKVQRRAHFRVAVHLPAVLNVIQAGTEASAPLRGDIDNLSGGGFRMALPAAVPEGSVVRVRLPVVTLLGYSFEARVIHCSEARDFGPMRYRARCEFIHLPEETRNLIVSYCFDVQREMRDGSRAA